METRLIIQPVKKRLGPLIQSRASTITLPIHREARPAYRPEADAARLQSPFSERRQEFRWPSQVRSNGRPVPGYWHHYAAGRAWLTRARDTRPHAPRDGDWRQSKCRSPSRTPPRLDCPTINNGLRQCIAKIGIIHRCPIKGSQVLNLKALVSQMRAQIFLEIETGMIGGKSNDRLGHEHYPERQI